MSEEGFHLIRVHKMQEWLESEATDWVISAITMYYEVENVEDLTQEQIEEVISFWEDGMNNYYDDQYIALGLSNAIHTWENENDVYLT